MNIRKNYLTILAMVMIYYLFVSGGFLLLSYFGIYYNGSKIHIYAIPMMLAVSLYVYLING